MGFSSCTYASSWNNVEIVYIFENKFKILSLFVCKWILISKGPLLSGYLSVLALLFASTKYYENCVYVMCIINHNMVHLFCKTKPLLNILCSLLDIFLVIKN